MLERFGVGIDIVDINRFNEKPFEQNQNFYKKMFLDSEINYCLNKNNSSESFAAKFAIKESVIKSISKNVDFLDILTDYVNSKPIVQILNDSSYNFLVSVSHEKSNAIAVVISEKNE